MRLYAVADIHGHTGRIETIRKTVAEQRPDLLVVAGDISGYVKAGQTLDALARVAVPILCIRGNSDLPHVEKMVRATPGMKLLGPSPHTVAGQEFLGLNGTLPLPFHSRVRAREKKAFDALQPRVTSASVLVVHPPPFGILDKVGKRFSAGSRNLARFIRTHHPRLVICGHIHEQTGYRQMQGTLVINCAMGKTGRGAIIDLPETGAARVNLLNR